MDLVSFSIWSLIASSKDDRRGPIDYIDSRGGGAKLG
jgi:hypothetical protein